MSKIAKIALCALLVVALAIPAFADSAAQKQSTGPRVADKVSDAVYKGSISAFQTTEGLLSGCLKKTFGLFNPCLDLAKITAEIALIPVEKPMEYFESAVLTPRPAKKAAAKVPEPQKPEIPQK